MQLNRDEPFRWSKKSRAFVVDNLFSIECAEIEDLVAVLEEGKCPIAANAHRATTSSLKCQ